MSINRGSSKSINSVTAHYSDASSKNIDLDACNYQSNEADITVSNGVITVASGCASGTSAKITVRYSEGGVTKSAIVNVNVPGG